MSHRLKTEESPSKNLVQRRLKKRATANNNPTELERRQTPANIRISNAKFFNDIKSCVQESLMRDLEDDKHDQEKYSMLMKDSIISTSNYLGTGSQGGGTKSRLSSSRFSTLGEDSVFSKNGG